jgi:hypothetical protein
LADRPLETAEEINQRLLALRSQAPRHGHASITGGADVVIHRVVERLTNVPTVSREHYQVREFLLALRDAMREMRRRAARRGISPDGDIMEALLSWDADEASRELDAWQRSGDRLLLITGNKGAGKSSLAGRAMMLHPYHSDGEEAPPYIITAHALAEALARPYDEPRRAIVRRASSLRLIVIDDYGSVALDEEQSQKMNDYLCRSLATGVRVIITSNEEPKVLQTMLFRDGRLRDRAQLGMRAMHLSNSSRRVAKAAARARARALDATRSGGRESGA